MADEDEESLHERAAKNASSLFAHARASLDSASKQLEDANGVLLDALNGESPEKLIAGVTSLWINALTMPLSCFTPGEPVEGEDDTVPDDGRVPGEDDAAAKPSVQLTFDIMSEASGPLVFEGTTTVTVPALAPAAASGTTDLTLETNPAVKIPSANILSRRLPPDRLEIMLVRLGALGLPAGFYSGTIEGQSVRVRCVDDRPWWFAR